MRFLIFLLLSLPATAQIKDQDLEGITVKSKRLTARAILDSVVKNAPRNYAEPMEMAGTYTSHYTRGTDTALYLQQPVYLKKREDFIYGFLQVDSTEANVLKDNIRSKAQYEHAVRIGHFLFPVFSNILAFMQDLDNIANTKRILYASDGDEADPHFYLLIRPKGKIHISLIVRPFISSLDKDSVFFYKILKIRRRGWVVTSYENSLLVNDPVKLQELIHTASFTRAKELIDSAKAQPNLRRYVSTYEWRPSDKGRYYIYRSGRSDNLINFAFTPFQKHPDPGGFTSASEIVYDYEKEIPEKLKLFVISRLLKDEKKY